MLVTMATRATLAIVLMLFASVANLAGAIVTRTVLPNARMVTSTAAHFVPVIMSKTSSPILIVSRVKSRVVDCAMIAAA